MSKSTALTSLADEIAAELAKFRQQAPAPTSNTIKITQNRQFSFPNGMQTDDGWQAIVLDWRWVNSYFDGGYDGKNSTPPICRASGTDQRTMGPAGNIQTPQCDTCYHVVNGRLQPKCEMNKFGPDPKRPGKNIKLCKNTARVALIPLDSTLNPERIPMILTVSPTAIKPFSDYIEDLAGKSLLPLQVITMIQFDPQQSYPKVTFGRLPMKNEELEWALKAKHDIRSDLDRTFTQE